MDSFNAFNRAQEAISKGAISKVFDWDKAARIIKERNPKWAKAGLRGDMEWTGGLIWYDGKPVDSNNTYTYLMSVWATPILEVSLSDEDDDYEVIECYLMDNDNPNKWNAATYWAESALNIVNNV